MERDRSWRGAFLESNEDAWALAQSSDVFHCPICAIMLCLKEEYDCLCTLSVCENCRHLCGCGRSVSPVLRFVQDDYQSASEDRKRVYDVFMRWYRDTYSRDDLILEFLQRISRDGSLEIMQSIIYLLDAIQSNGPPKKFDWMPIMTQVGEEDCVCAICKEAEGDDGKLKCTPCNHVFHEGCIQKWGEIGNSTCPVCRRECNTEE